MLPKELSGKYEARGPLGAGAMGTVIEAFDRMIERRVAVKLVKLPGGGDAEAQEAHARFRREAQAAGRLSHPNIVGVFDYGENADTAWIVMELVEGGTLKGVLDRGERLAVPQIVRLMDQVLGALAYSHGRGVVHRDIKPANIMLGLDGAVKIADFGIARIESSTMTQVGTIMGTPSYMAPEQLRGEPVDARADIWAAGVLLYQLLTGDKPFDGSYSALMHRVMSTEPPPPSQLAVSVPRAFDAVVARALAKRPGDRFPSAGAFAEAVRAAGSGEATGSSAAEGFGGGFAGAGKLPGLDDATMVAQAGAGQAGNGQMGTGPTGRTTPPRPAPPPPPVPAKGGSRALLLGGVALLAAAGGAAFFLMQPAPPAVVANITPGPTAPDPAPPRAPAAPVSPFPGAAPPAVPNAPAAAVPLAPQPAPSAPPALPAPPSLGVLTPPSFPAAPQSPAAPPAAMAPAQPTPAQPPAALPTPPPQAATPTQPSVASTANGLPKSDPAPASSPNTGPQIAALPLPTPAPAPPPAPVVLPARPDFRAALAFATGAAPCSLVTGTATDTGLTLAGVLQRGGAAQIQRVLTERAIPAQSVTLRLQGFDGPYCGALDTIRQVAAGLEEMPQVELVGTSPLQRGDLLRLDVRMPPRAGQLYVSYLMKSNEIVHLVPSEPQSAGARLRLGEPRPGFPGWEVDEPYGTDLIILFASERPLFAQPRPQMESLDAYLPALGAALREARTQGVRVSARAIVVETVATR